MIDDLKTALYDAYPRSSAHTPPDWEDVLARAGVTRRKTEKSAMRPPVRRRWLVPAVVAGTLVFAAVAYSAVGGLPWWETGAPPVHRSIVEQQLAPPSDRSEFPPVNRALARTVAVNNGAALVAAPIGKTGYGYCLIPSLPGQPNLGYQCVWNTKTATQSSTDIFDDIVERSTQGKPRWIVYGRYTESGAASLDLTNAVGGRLRIPLRRGGFFIADLPPARWQAIAHTAGVGALLDASGHTIRKGCFAWGSSPRSSEKTRTPSTTGGAPCHVRKLPTIDVGAAMKLFELTLTADFSRWQTRDRVAIWEAPQSNGQSCAWPGTVEAPPTPFAGNDCRSKSQPWPAGTAFQIQFSGSHSERAGNLTAVQGWTSPRVARMSLLSREGITSVPFGSDYYFVQLPGSSGQIDQLPDEGPYTLIAYDASGNVVSRKSVDQAWKTLNGLFYGGR